MFKKAYSLSETLITLAIVGIVFTIAAGMLAADYNKTQTVVRLEKAYSIISQAFFKSVALNGSSSNWDIDSNLSESGSYNFFSYYLKPSFVLLRDCKNSIHGQCAFVFKELDGTEKSLNSTWVRFYLNDGMFIALQTISHDDYKVIYFYVDTNGKKRLNVVARDIFVFQYFIKNRANPELEGKLLPLGYGLSREELISNSDINNCNVNSNGNNCAALIMLDNWQILQGYPWSHARYIVQ